MTKRAGVYTIVQYSPVPYSGEAANIGVVVLVPDGGLEVRMAARNERVKKMFGAESFSDERLTSAKRALEARLRALPLQEDALIAFMATSAGEISLVPLRQLVVDDLLDAASMVFDEFVQDPPAVTRRRSHPIDLEPQFRELIAQGIVKKPPRIIVPIIGEELQADLSFTNGVRNYIKSIHIPDQHEAAFEAASTWGTRGMFLHEHPDPSDAVTARRLIVVGDRSDDDLLRIVRPVLEGHGVELVVPEGIPQLVDRARTEGH